MSERGARVALVTGGSRGIGAAVARRLAVDGLDVAITYRQARGSAAEVVDAVTAAGRRALALQVDVAEPDAVTAAVDRVVEELGPVDVLVTSAGIFPVADIGAVTTAEFDRAVDVHVRGVVVAAQAVLRDMPDGGRIVMIGSSLAERVPGPGLALYALTKAALVGFCRGLARDVGHRGIAVTVVQPGSTDTDMNPAGAPEAEAERALTALGRYARPEEVAAMVAHLSSPDGGYVTGTAITVDGGATA